jgi:AcrR family transcriptional regulator
LKEAVVVLDRRGGESAGTREAILDATEALMVEEGYTAVTSRRVAEKAGQKSKLVHYYFATMDDLFVALYERAEKQFLKRHLEAVTSPNPLRALWELSVHPQRTRLAQEFIALSNHRPSIRKITARVLEQLHAINTSFISRYLQEAGVDQQEFPPVVISQIISGLSRALVNEESLGVAPGHSEVHAFAERWLSRLEARHEERRPEQLASSRARLTDEAIQ